MSGLVATRLFDLLPPRMPLADKYALIEKLWRHVDASSKKILRVGLDTQAEAVTAAVHDYLSRVVVTYEIPASLSAQFEWLAAGDASVKQQLLNYLQHRQRELVVYAARVQVPIMLEHLRGEEGTHTHRLTQILKVGKHELEILIDKAATGISVEEPIRLVRPSASVAPGADLTWMWWVAGIIILVWLFS